jgi:hypothetical protein
MHARRISLFLFAIAASLIPDARVEACAVCLSGAAGGDRLTDAFNWSVLFLMGAPYVVFGSVAGWLFYLRRRAHREGGRIGDKLPALRLSWVNKGSGK